jgi:ubiquinone/menaquinone biosynthesis C-methylase UbiE
MAGVAMLAERAVGFFMHDSSDANVSCVGPIRDFLGLDSTHAQDILSWDDALVDLAVSVLPGIACGACIPADSMGKMQANGLADSSRKLTALGSKLAYHIAEYNTQSDPSQACDLAEEMNFRTDSKVLDIGCGAGQTLFRLQQFGLAECVGVDRDIESLAWGCRLQPRFHAAPVEFVCAPGDALPFADDRFTHVISRVALNYMRQSRALEEMARVMQPGGMLSLRLMNAGFYVGLLRKARTPRQAAASLHKLCWGCVAAITGFQIDPTRKWAAHEIFAPLFRMRKLLLKAGCRVVRWKHIESSFGLPVATILVAKKEG